MPCKFGEELKSRLRVPMGPVYPSMPEFPKARRIIAVGDIVVIGLLKKGITPFAAAFDLRTRREPLSGSEKALILSHFPNPAKALNPAGTLTDEAMAAAKTAMSKGGAVLIEGEEDLTLLAFMEFAKKGDVFVYGIMDSGVCAVDGSKAKAIAERFLKIAEKDSPA
jgi:uncharacterized protein (UPF0218 family)